jgi:hypothetical protein
MRGVEKVYELMLWLWCIAVISIGTFVVFGLYELIKWLM